MNYKTISLEDLGVTLEYASFCPEEGVGEWHIMLHVESRQESFEDQIQRVYAAEDRLPELPDFRGAQYILKRYFLSDSTNQQPFMRKDPLVAISPIQQQPLDGSKVAVIGSGYNDRLFNTEGRMERKPGEPVRICYAGKISRPKGVPEMLAALSMLAGDDEVPPFELTMAGGCQDEVLKDKLDGLPDYATWLGQIPQPALAELLRRTDVFVLPSYFEGLPLVLIEAMASGAVPVSTDLPGVKDWIDANVIRPNVIYVPMPEMKSIDRPTETGRSAFVDDLASALKRAITGFGSGTLPGAKPDTSAITWDGVAKRLLSLCRP